MTEAQRQRARAESVHTWSSTRIQVSPKIRWVPFDAGGPGRLGFFHEVSRDSGLIASEQWVELGTMIRVLVADSIRIARVMGVHQKYGPIGTESRVHYIFEVRFAQ